MNAQEFASATAHEIAADAIRLRVDPPDAPAVGVTIIDDVKIVVMIAKYEGPAKLYLTELGRKTLGDIGESAPPPPAQHLSGLQKRVLHVLASDKGRTGASIAAKLHVAYGGGFRQSLAALLKMGYAVNEGRGRGYRLTPHGLAARAS